MTLARCLGGSDGCLQCSKNLIYAFQFRILFGNFNMSARTIKGRAVKRKTLQNRRKVKLLEDLNISVISSNIKSGMLSGRDLSTGKRFLVRKQELFDLDSVIEAGKVYAIPKGKNVPVNLAESLKVKYTPYQSSLGVKLRDRKFKGKFSRVGGVTKFTLDHSPKCSSGDTDDPGPMIEGEE